MTSRSLTIGSTQIHAEEAYFTDGRLQETRNYGAGSPAAEVALTDYTYYNDGRLNTLVAKDSQGGSTPTNTVMNYSYVNDPGGRLSSKTENSTTTSYGYDNTNQLTTVNGSTVASYDPTGNRTNTGYVTTTGNQLSTDGTYNYAYDAEGNLITQTNIATGDYWTYGYDERNHMISAVEKTSGGTVEKSATYVYDAFGNRIEKDVTVSGTTTVTKFVLDGWDPAKGPAIGNENWDVLADITSTGSLTSRYLRGDVVDQLFARIDKSGSTLTPYWYLTDNQGSVRTVVDNSGYTQDSVIYDAFGNVTSETAPAYRGRYGFAGREVDAETGLENDRARERNLSTDRWQMEDPIGFGAGDANLYRVVGNEATDATDPSGMVELNIDPETGRAVSASTGKYVGIVDGRLVWRNVGNHRMWAFLSDVQAAGEGIFTRPWDSWFRHYGFTDYPTLPPLQPPAPAPVLPAPVPPSPAPQQAPPTQQAPANQSPSSCPGNEDSQIGSVDRWGAPILPTDLQLGPQQPITTDAFASFSNLSAALGDFASYGGTSWLRNDLGYDSSVDYNSFAYQGTSFGATFASMAIGAPALARGALNLAKGGLHHYIPTFMGSMVPRGNSILTPFRQIGHISIHRALNNFLKPLGMAPSSVNTGMQIIRNFSPVARLDALDTFYSIYQGGAHHTAFLEELAATIAKGLFR